MHEKVNQSQSFDNDLLLRIHDLQSDDWNIAVHGDLSIPGPFEAKDFFKVFKNFKLQHFYDAENIYLVETNEVYNLNKIDTPRFRYIKGIVDFFAALGLSDKLCFLNNDWNAKDNKFIRHETICSFVGMNYEEEETSVEDLLKFRNGNYSKDFSFLSRKVRPHRVDIFKFLSDNNITDHTLFSHGEKAFEGDTPLDSFNFIGSRSSMIGYPDQIVRDTGIAIAAETFFYTNDYTEGTCFITEKTDKNLYYMIPFVVVGQPKVLTKLRELGFKTFSNFWDESYDDEFDDTKRMAKVKSTLMSIYNMSAEDKKKLHSDIVETLLHNKNLHTKIRNIRKNNYTRWGTSPADFAFTPLDYVKEHLR